jgi:hypothetical protein
VRTHRRIVQLVDRAIPDVREIRELVRH